MIGVIFIWISIFAVMHHRYFCTFYSNPGSVNSTTIIVMHTNSMKVFACTSRVRVQENEWDWENERETKFMGAVCRVYVLLRCVKTFSIHIANKKVKIIPRWATGAVNLVLCSHSCCSTKWTASTEIKVSLLIYYFATEITPHWIYVRPRASARHVLSFCYCNNKNEDDNNNNT